MEYFSKSVHLTIDQWQRDGVFVHKDDDVVTELPLEIYVSRKGKTQRLSVTMRTPGDDEDLATGFLCSEGIIRSYSDIRMFRFIENRDSSDVTVTGIIAELQDHVSFEPGSDDKADHITNSACGICAKHAFEEVYLPDSMRVVSPADMPLINPEIIAGLPLTLIDHQSTFRKTGGIHAAALFDKDGTLLAFREDVGRHNAMDKLTGWALRNHHTSVSESIVLFSGRISFELVQKAVVAGFRVMAAIGAPSSLAIQLAEEYGATLIGFIRENRFNVYCGKELFRR